MERTAMISGITGQDKINEEISKYKNVENVHDLPAAFHYCTNFLGKKLIEQFGFKEFDKVVEYHINIIKKSKDEKDIKILSLGSGNCDFEIESLSNKYNLKCQFFCMDLNTDMLVRGRKLAEKYKVSDSFVFLETDINKVLLEQKYDIIIANHSLHHFAELEHIFKQVNNAMFEKSYFIINDMIGGNGHMSWDNTFELQEKIWEMLPKELKFNHQFNIYTPKLIQWDCSRDGFEGIRAQDILPLLDSNFDFSWFIPFFCLIGRFIERGYGHNFDVNNQFHQKILDMLWGYEEYCLSNKLLKPTQLIAVMMKKAPPPPGTTSINEMLEHKFIFFEHPSEIYEMDDTRVKLFFEIEDKTDVNKKLAKLRQSVRIVIWYMNAKHIPLGTKRRRLYKMLWKFIGRPFRIL
ncbi:hypothetical protein AGMMS49942_21590 [Spirochaetia bacterium]|nr:hypothetical protein AGMMS49942_21590 [Spirochaetia bacterium]